jgi:AAA family ATP:ADP antiporter
MYGRTIRAMLTSFTFFFFLLSSYFVLRPIRDAVAAASGVRTCRGYSWHARGHADLQPALLGTRGSIPDSARDSDLLSFFVANLLAFYAFRSRRHRRLDCSMWIGRTFFVWTTVFALFNTSIFWSLMADAFRSEQAKRMFGFIGVGGTFG